MPEDWSILVEKATQLPEQPLPPDAAAADGTATTGKCLLNKLELVQSTSRNCIVEYCISRYEQKWIAQHS